MNSGGTVPPERLPDVECSSESSLEHTTTIGQIDLELRNYAFDPTEFEIFRLYPSLVVLIVIVYVIVVVLGSIGNVLVFCVIVRRSEMWSPTNVLIANLALADIFVCSFVLPVSLYHQLTDDWVFGRVLCHTIPTAHGVVVYASTLTLTAIAIDRYILIVFPMAAKITTSTAVLMVVGIAVSSVSVAAPIAVYSQYKVIDYPELSIMNRRMCIELWPNKDARKTYAVLTLVMQYFIPLILIALLYSLIFHRIRHRMPSKRGASRRTKTNLMLVAVVFVFAVAWTPYQLFSVICEFQWGLVSGKYFKLSDLALRALAMSSSCVNPFLYGWLNDNFRNAFIDILGRFLPRARTPYGSAGSTRGRLNRCGNGESSMNFRSGLVLGQRGQRVQWTSRLFGRNKEDIAHELSLLGHALNEVERNGGATAENFL